MKILCFEKADFPNTRSVIILEKCYKKIKIHNWVYFVGLRKLGPKQTLPRVFGFNSFA